MDANTFGKPVVPYKIVKPFLERFFSHDFLQSFIDGENFNWSSFVAFLSSYGVYSLLHYDNWKSLQFYGITDWKTYNDLTLGWTVRKQAVAFSLRGKYYGSVYGVFDRVVFLPQEYVVITDWKQANDMFGDWVRMNSNILGWTVLNSHAHFFNQRLLTTFSPYVGHSFSAGFHFKYERLL
ncbi:MAG: hypothetical protein ACK4SW_08645 [Sulfurihydrogenibium azorense]